MRLYFGYLAGFLFAIVQHHHNLLVKDYISVINSEFRIGKFEYIINRLVPYPPKEKQIYPPPLNPPIPHPRET